MRMHFILVSTSKIWTKTGALKYKGFFGVYSRCIIDPMKYGYARVSTDGQSVDAQVRQLTKAGCKKVFREVASGAKAREEDKLFR
jgi:predicted site-specific integrase-resolvase